MQDSLLAHALDQQFIHSDNGGERPDPHELEELLQASGLMLTTGTIPAAPIMDALKDQANEILGSALNGVPLQAYAVGQAGGFPYNWMSTSNLKFNSKTYDWIKLAMAADERPFQSAESFVNAYIEVISKVTYKLSGEDQRALDAAQQDALAAQQQLLLAWQTAFGTLPEPAGAPPTVINAISDMIATQWAVPATTLTEIQKSTNLNALLNNVPAAGKPIVPVFAAYLNALGSATSLLNQTTMNNAYLQQALLNTQNASTANGGLQLSDGSTVPAFQVSTTVKKILDDLKNDANVIKLSMQVHRDSLNEFQLKVDGGVSFRMPVLGFLGISVGAKASYFVSDIAIESNTTTVEMSYPGVALANFGPVGFEKSTGLGWSWQAPIVDAIENEGQDVSGFQFSPDPGVDFGENGGYGYFQGVAISNQPTIKITVQGSNYEQIQKTFEQSVSSRVTFLGIPLGIGGSESSYSNKVETNSSEQTVTITLSPPPGSVAPAGNDAQGFVLGVQPMFPASKA